jgi:hypothetical protein
MQVRSGYKTNIVPRFKGSFTLYNLLNQILDNQVKEFEGQELTGSHI